MRTRLSSKQTIAKDLSYVKEGGELFFEGDEFEDPRWVTVVGVPDEDSVVEDTEIECVDEKGRKFTCFADQLSAKDSSGAGVDDPAYFKVAKNLRRAANGYVNQKFASVKVAKKEETDKEIFTIDLFNETKVDGVDTKETTKVYYDADEAIKVAEELIKGYADEEDEYTVSVYAGEYEKPSGDIYGEVTSIWEKSNKRWEKTASAKVAAEGDAEVSPKPTGELTSEDMWSWLQKQAQYKSVVETISNEIANNAVEDVMFGRALNQNPAGGTVQNAYDWAVRLLKNQFASQIGKMRVQKDVEPVDAPEIPEIPEVEESVEVEAKTASRKRLTAK